jgi:Protein of unknown function (DUF2752)
MIFFLSLYNNLTSWLETHLLSCPSKKYLHIECPGCGLQRSFIALLKGDFVTSFQLYPATIPILLMLVLTALHLKFRFERGATAIKYTQAGIAIVIAVFYIYKIVNHKIIA